MTERDRTSILCEFNMANHPLVKQIVLESCGFAQFMAAVTETVQSKKFSKDRDNSHRKSCKLAEDLNKVLVDSKVTLIESAIALHAICAALVESAKNEDGSEIVRVVETEITVKADGK